jgi:hypothetical protein
MKKFSPRNFFDYDFAFISLHRPLEVVDPDHHIRNHTEHIFWIGEGKQSAQVLVYDRHRTAQAAHEQL